MILGRKLRSFGIAYAQAARAMLELALKDADVAMKQDPTWVRGMQRNAEALLALGPNERAADACVSLEMAIQLLAGSRDSGKPSSSGPKSPELCALLERARAAAHLWKAVRVDVPPPQALAHALLLLLRSTFSSRAVGPAAQGRDVAESMGTVAAVLRAGYTNPSWSLDGLVDLDQVHLDLRMCAKCVPLAAVEASQELWKLASMDAPWSLFGLDRLDRVNADSLPLGSQDPCAKEGTLKAPHELDCLEWLASGLEKADELRDLTPQLVFGAFGSTLLQRLVLSPRSKLFNAAAARLITLQGDSLGRWAGGKFLEHALRTAACVGSSAAYRIAQDGDRRARFLALDMSAHALATEIAMSRGSVDARYEMQVALAAITPDDWARRGPAEKGAVLRDYVVASLEGRLPRLKGDQDLPHAAAVLASMLLAGDSGPVRTAAEAVGCDSAPADAGQRLLTGRSSTFGRFLLRHLAAVLEADCCGTVEARARAAVLALAQRWYSLSPGERAVQAGKSLALDEWSRLAAGDVLETGVPTF